MELLISGPIEKQEYEFSIHESEEFSVSNSKYANKLKRIEVADCASLLKENDERAILLFNILSSEECEVVCLYSG